MAIRIWLPLVSIMLAASSVRAEQPPLSCPTPAELEVLSGEKGRIEYCATPDGALHGPAREWYPNGAQRTSDNWRDGKKHGRWLVFDEHGAKREERFYSDGQLQGPETHWFSNGQTRSVTCWAAGRKQGPVAEWTESGVQVVRGQHEDDLMDGFWYFKRPADSLEIRVRFTAGEDSDPEAAPFPEETAGRLTKQCS